MKFLAYILTFMILSLSVKSGNEAILFASEVQKPCCSLDSETTSDHQDNTQDGDICNPFQACCSCLLIITYTPFAPVIETAISTEHSFGYQPPLTSQFITDFWQPPQSV